ncbi:MAG: radical SAM protein, partial [Chthoniobacterales bacterium]
MPIADHRLPSSDKIEHLYVHVPFCPKICPYCSFYKLSGGTDFRQDFVKALLKELDFYADRLRPQTIFFGGGTPTMLTLAQLKSILEAIHEKIDLTKLREWTFEMNPATVNAAKARLLVQGGVTRFSMGVQAWQPRLLKTLGRIHSPEQVTRSTETLRKAGV